MSTSPVIALRLATVFAPNGWTPEQAARQLSSRKIREGYKPQSLHVYRAADGTPLYWRVRLKHPHPRPDQDRKWIRPMRRDPDGYRALEPEFPRGEKPLYGLERLAAADATTPVFAVEGEPCADALAKLGILATTSGGSTSADGADWSSLEGRACVLWPDHDDPGAKYILDVAHHLQALGCAVRLIAPEVVEALPEHGDIADWLAQHPGATRADIEALPTVPAPEFRSVRSPGREGAEEISWPEPTPLPDALPTVQAFDAELLPESLRGWNSDIAERMQCPPDFPAVAAVVALSGLVGARAVITPKERDDWRVVPNLWGLIIGRPGVMKSPAADEAMKPLRRMEAAERERWQAAHDDWKRDCAVVELAAKVDAKRAAKFATTDRARARELLGAAEVPPEPRMRRYVATDVTQEKLADLLTVNPWGFLVYRDELHGLLAALDKPGQEGSRGFYLTAYSGDQPYAVDRIGRGEFFVPRVCFALLGSMQPGKAQRYVREAMSFGEGDDGLLQRFGLAVWPDVAREWRKVDRWPDTPARQAANAVFNRLNALPTEDGAPAVWRFTPEAQGLYWDWAEPFERELRGDALHPALVSHLAKYRKLVPALALLFALADSPETGVVGKPELLRALAWSDYLRTHAGRLYAAAVTPETAGAEALMAKLRAGALTGGDGARLDTFTPRLIAVKHWAGLTTPANVRKAADLLVDYGWLARELVESDDALGRGRPSERYRLHPALLAGGAS